MTKVCFFTSLDDVSCLTAVERGQLSQVTAQYPFRSNEYFLSLINWEDPADPIRRIVIPAPSELDDDGALDPSCEQFYTRVSGLEHKYEHVALLLVSDSCGGYCRFCFRKRIFMGSDEVERDVSAGIDYIRRHPKINNVLLTGGDPLLLATDQLAAIIEQLREIDHVRIIRIGSKMPLYNPFRVLDDNALIEMFARHSRPDRRIFLIIHTNHPRELTPEATAAIDRIQRSGVTVMNQTPLLRGINDDPAVLADLFDKLSFRGVLPYYVFQCRPTRGNRCFSVPVERAFEIHEQARMRVSGLGRNARFVMSHTIGKIQVLCLKKDTIILKIHRAADSSQQAHIYVFRRNPDALWFDDYTRKVTEFQLDNPFLLETKDEYMVPVL